MDEVPITVHFYNPFVADEDIRIFLRRFCSSVSSGERVQGRFGIWNGKRRFLAKLRVDPSAPGGLLHPPGGFSIGPHRWFLYYPSQPLYCRRCGALGHTKEKCSGRRCCRCGGEDHATAECGAPKTCSLCGSEDHLFRHCPSWKGTFTDLFAEGLEAVAAPPRQQQEGPAPGSGTACEPEAVREAGVSAEEAADHPEEQRPPPTEFAGAEGNRVWSPSRLRGRVRNRRQQEGRPAGASATHRAPGPPWIGRRPSRAWKQLPAQSPQTGP
ncbi:hypothetical protein QTP70_001790 [Hemibagrus guttatus]|uniref:Phorbol-ester/DAG-type domain-containing protein n=1 Tax=Hemibagrus guttatus TaxID=175788 RepID=A0AAE0V687_9TELE|nr:hypothetical protein QTP70_001790 [Hemibagrus guttatus]